MTYKITSEIESVIDAGRAATRLYGQELQLKMAVEEMGELLTALSRYDRKRATSEDVTYEAADVLITVMQVGLIYGGTEGFARAIKEKVERLEARLAEHIAREG